MSYRNREEYDAAWLQAWQTRSCPPGEILFGEKTVELTDHLELCPACRDLLATTEDQDLQLNRRFGSMLKSMFEPKEAEPASGQVWSLNKNLEGWGPKFRYFSSPLVLVLEKIDDAAIRVAQIHEIALFREQDDVRLGDNFAGYAEKWNTYTLRKSDLARCWGRVADEVVRQVLGPLKKNRNQPETASLLVLFRRLEIETGFFFSSRAVGSLMRMYEKQAEIVDIFQREPTPETEKALLDSHFTPPDHKVVSIQEYLLRSRLKDERLPLAAAGVELYAGGPLLTISENNRECITTTSCRYNFPDYDPGDHSMTVEGSFDELPPDINEELVAFAWLLPDNNLIAADDIWFDLSDKRFHVLFAGIPSLADAEQGQLRFCLINGTLEHHD